MHGAFTFTVWRCLIFLFFEWDDIFLPISPMSLLPWQQQNIFIKGCVFVLCVRACDALKERWQGSTGQKKKKKKRLCHKHCCHLLIAALSLLLRLDSLTSLNIIFFDFWCIDHLADAHFHEHCYFSLLSLPGSRWQYDVTAGCVPRVFPKLFYILSPVPFSYRTNQQLPEINMTVFFFFNSHLLYWILRFL